MNWTQFLSILAIIYGLYYSFFIFLDMLRTRSSKRADPESEQLLAIPKESAVPNKSLLAGAATTTPQKVELPVADLSMPAPVNQQPTESSNTGSKGGLALSDLVDQALKDSIENMKDIFNDKDPAPNADRGR